MIEVEIKVYVQDRKCLEERLLCLGFVKGNLIKETDRYFDSDQSRIRKNGMALRVRCCENITANTTEHYMTFKGPKMDRISMSRKELEMQIESSDKGKEILAELGYIPVIPVVKLRQYYRRNRITACLDQVEELGCYMELEMVVPDEGEKEGALETLFSLLQDLGYAKSDVINTSYLSLLQAAEK